MTPAHAEAIARRRAYLDARRAYLAEVHATLAETDARHADTMDALRAECSP